MRVLLESLTLGAITVEAARIRQRLDTALISIAFQDIFPSLKILHLERVGSDNTPICFHFQDTGPRRKVGSYFQRIWVDHPGFMDVVTQAWSKNFTGNPGFVLQRS